MKHQLKHFFYAAGWKKFEPLWDVVIRAKRLAMMTPLLEGVLSKVTSLDGPGTKDGPRTKDEGPRTSDLVPLDLDAVPARLVTMHRRHKPEEAALPAVAK